MPDQKISELAAITTIDNAADVLPIVDTSATTTKKITLTQVKTSLALNNVDNTSDLSKPISTATQTALDNKAPSTAIAATAIGTGLVSTTEFNYLDGVTSAIQSQLDAKAPSTGILAANIGAGTVNNTEFGYLDGVTSAIQTQLDAKTAKLITTNRQTASYTLVIGDADKLVEINNASANNLTVPLNSSVAFATGTQILLAQYGAGQTTIVATSGVTIRSNGAKLKLNAQYSGATLVKIAENEWYLFGDIA
jgi:hypothetical protein